MANIKKLTPGQRLYTVTKVGMGRVKATRTAVHGVVVQSIDLENEIVVASWNSNPPQRFTKKQVATWKTDKPTSK